MALENIAFSGHRYHILRRAVQRLTDLQTLLEQMKGIFKKVQGIPPSKIPPTVGLNGKCYTSLY